MVAKTRSMGPSIPKTRSMSRMSRFKCDGMEHDGGAEDLGSKDVGEERLLTPWMLTTEALAMRDSTMITFPATTNTYDYFNN